MQPLFLSQRYKENDAYIFLGGRKLKYLILIEE